MKKIIILLTILLVLFSFRTSKIVITVDLGVSSETGKNIEFDVSLFITGEDFSSKKIATTKCIDGKFTFEVDPVDSPKMAYISYNGSGHNIILENHDVKLTYRRDSGYKIEGGVYNSLIFEWESSDESIKLNIALNYGGKKELITAFRNMVKTEQVIGRIQRSAKDKDDAIIYDYIDKHSLLEHQFKNNGSYGCRHNIYIKLGCRIRVA